MKPDAFRRMALGLEGAIEGAHMSHPDFRIGGRIFASIRQDLLTATVRLTPEDQGRFIADAPDTFSPEAGAWGRDGWTRIALAAADEDAVGEALTLAWRERQVVKKGGQKSTKRAATKRAATKKAGKEAIKRP
jgi:hypothetical protein